jgi:hypothetical protein
MPEEKAAPGKEPSAQPLDMEPTAESEPEKRILEDVRATIADESVQKPHWVRAAYAAVIGFLVVSVGFTIFMMQGNPPDSANEKAKKEAAPPAGSAVESATTSASDVSRSQDASVRGQAPGVSGEGRTIQVPKTKKRETVGSRRSSEQARQAQAERSRRDREAPERATPAEDTGRGASTVSREPASPGTQDVESGKVIDFLIKKRSEQK